MPHRIAIVGAASAVGGVIAAQCEADASIERTVAIDRTQPRILPDKAVFVACAPGASLTEALRDHGVQRACYLSPFPVGASAAEPPSEPALDAFLEACAVCGVEAVAVASGPWAYALSRDDGAPLTEGKALNGAAASLGAADLRRERATALFARDHPQASVALCRLAPVVGPGTKGVAARLLAAPKLMRLAGFAPKLQFVHIEDAGLAIHRLLAGRHSGVYNVAPDDALTMMDLGRCLRRPIGSWRPGVARACAGAGRLLGRERTFGVDGAVLPLLMHSIVLANKKLKREAGYRFKYASDGAVTAHAKRGAPF